MEWLLLVALLVFCIVLLARSQADRKRLTWHEQRLFDLETYAGQVHTRLRALEAAHAEIASLTQRLNRLQGLDEAAMASAVPRGVEPATPLRGEGQLSGIAAAPGVPSAMPVPQSAEGASSLGPMTAQQGSGSPGVQPLQQVPVSPEAAPLLDGPVPVAMDVSWEERPVAPTGQPELWAAMGSVPQAPQPSAGLPGTQEAPSQPEAQAPAPPDASGTGASPESSGAASRRAFDWESLVGVRLFSWVAGIALVLAAVFFLRYSVESGWLTPPIRVAIGMMVGIGLLVGSELRGARYRITANALDAAGIATLFSTSFAATALWHLIPMGAAFVLLALTAATAVLLSLRRDSLFIALLGLLGGFATPILLSTGEDRPIGLFGYLLLLNVGLGVVGHRKRWPVLLGASVALTALYQFGWVAKFVADDPSELPLAAVLFILFPTVTVILHAIGRRWREQPSTDARAAGAPGTGATEYGVIVSVSALLPLLFALCLAIVPAFGKHPTLLWIYLLVLDTGLLALDILRPKEPLLPIGALATLLVQACWLTASYSSSAWPDVLVFSAAFVVLFLAGPAVARLLGRSISDWTRRTQYTAPLLLFSFPVLCSIEPEAKSPYLLFGVLFALMALISAAAVVRENGPLYFGTAFFALLTEVAWSGKHLTEEQSKTGLLLYAAFGLFYLGVPAIARRMGRSLKPEGSASVLLLASILLVLFVAAGPGASSSLWGIGLLLVIINIGIFTESRSGRIPVLSMVGVGLSWVVIGVLWYASMTPHLIVPSLIVMAALGLVALAGNASVLRGREGVGGDASALGQGGLLGLVGHAFLFYVAAQPSLSTPPWPMLAILVLLDLGALAFALYTQRMLVLQAALVASPVIVLVWLFAADSSVPFALPWGHVALFCGLGFAALTLACRGLFVLRRLDAKPLALASEIVLNEAIVLAAVLGGRADAPDLLWLLVAQSLPILALIGLGRSIERDIAMFVAVLAAALGQTLWSSAHFRYDRFYEELLIAGVPYALFSAYPILCGSTARTRRSPFFVAILAAVPAFLFGYHAMTAGQQSAIIGVLPLTQAIVVAGLLVYLLLRLEREPPRDTARLALVAAVALGFVTMAIPLQLENEWITIGWALEAAALAWLHTRLGHPGLTIGSFGLAAAVLVRLALNEAVFKYHPRAAVPVWNWYLYAYAVSAASLYLAAWLFGRGREPRWPVLRHVGWFQYAAATILFFLLVNIEIADWYSEEGTELTFNFSSTLAEDLTYTLGWGVFALGMLAFGIILRGRAVRIAALVLLTVTSAKCFLHDLWRLGGLYRVTSFVGLAICLFLVAIVLQRFVLPANSARETKS